MARRAPRGRPQCLLLALAVVLCCSQAQIAAARLLEGQQASQQAAQVPLGPGVLVQPGTPAEPVGRVLQNTAATPAAAPGALKSPSTPNWQQTAAGAAAAAATAAGAPAAAFRQPTIPAAAGGGVGTAAVQKDTAAVLEAATDKVTVTSIAARAFAASKAAATATAAVSDTAAAAVKAGAARAAARARSADALPALIPLELLLGESKFKNPQLSTDGQMLAYIKPAPDTNVSNVFIRKLPAPSPRHQQQRATMVELRSTMDAEASSDEDAEATGGASAAGDSQSTVSEAEAAELLADEEEVSIFDREDTDNDVQVTFDNDQGVSAYSWAEDGSAILFTQDKDGDENYHVFMAPVDTPGEAIDLTPFPGVKAQGIVSNELFPGKLYIGLNRRDPSVFDMYALDLSTLTLTLDTVNPGDVNNWLLDYDFKIRGAECYNNSNGAAYVILNDDLPPIDTSGTSMQRRATRMAQLRTRKPKTPPKKANTQATEGLFARAAKEGWGYEEWVAASSSRADVAHWRRLITWPFGEEGGVFKFNKAGDALYIITSVGRDTTEFQLISTAPGAKVLQRIATNPLSSVNSVEFDPESWEPQLVSFNYLQVQWTVLDPELKAEWGRIEAFRPGEEVSIVDRSFDEKSWILGYSGDSVNNKYYLHTPGSWPPRLLFDTQPALLPYSTSKTHSVVITARDGLLLPAYLSLPVKGSIPTTLPACVAGPVPDLKGQGRVDVSALRADVAHQRCKLDLQLPLVLAVHGGPWSRDTWGSDPVVQLLTNRGYAVLQVNYRASSGYGKRFMNLGDKQWGIGSMQHDLTDSVKWAVNTGIAHPKKVCIMGGSYGGYATLAGLAFTPDVYACGVDLVGISNAGTFMRSIPPYWEPLRYEWHTRVGPADSDEAFNRKISPLYHVDKIKAPLFIAQGAHDPRVPQAESDQMFRAMYNRGLPVLYVLYTDEGHGIAKPDNRQDYYSRVEQFLAQHLGGRAEAPKRIEGVSAVVVRDLKDLEVVSEYAKKGGEVSESASLSTSPKSAAKPKG